MREGRDGAGSLQAASLTRGKPRNPSHSHERARVLRFVTEYLFPPGGTR